MVPQPGKSCSKQKFVHFQKHFEESFKLEATNIFV